MNFIDSIFEKAAARPKRILLPEADDERTLRAAAAAIQRGIAHVSLIGRQDTVRKKCAEVSETRECPIIDPHDAPWKDEFAETYYAMRKTKGVTQLQARAAVLDPILHGMLLLRSGKGDGLVAGAIHSTADTLRPALQVIRTAPGVSLVSSFFFMAVGEHTYLFADCGLVENPDADELAEIALSSAATAMRFGIDPKVALLSYSTKGSADSPLTQKVVEATRIAQAKAVERFGPDSPVRIDGELQVDAAVVESVAKRKAPSSPLRGQARVLIFPDLNSGNIAYKLVERLGGARAYGPILQGLRMPVNDLSRGCGWEDILGVIAITVVQAQMNESIHRIETD
ncbi:MAG: hypothetical protein AMXMBFR4_27320 [Candidatus Hydrogenedentota bacterium]